MQIYLVVLYIYLKIFLFVSGIMTLKKIQKMDYSCKKNH